MRTTLVAVRNGSIVPVQPVVDWIASLTRMSSGCRLTMRRTSRGSLVMTSLISSAWPSQASLLSVLDSQHWCGVSTDPGLGRMR